MNATNTPKLYKSYNNIATSKKRPLPSQILTIILPKNSTRFL